MKYWLCLLICLFSSVAVAQDALTDSEDKNAPIRIIYPANNQNYLNTTDMPDCNDKKLISEVKAAIEEYLSNAPQVSIIENRKRNLVLKNVDEYKEIPVSEFNNADNYLVANELIMTKINRNMTDDDLRLCVGTGKKPVYLLIYPEDFRYRVQIINFISPTANGNAFAILYTPLVKQYNHIDASEMQN